MADETTTLDDLGALNGATGDNAAPVHEQKLDAHGRAYATGKRKDAVARVWLKPGSGRILVNKKDFTEYFARPVLQMLLRQPLNAAERDTQYDITATVSGGGLSGQAGAVRHGISKALTRSLRSPDSATYAASCIRMSGPPTASPATMAAIRTSPI